MIEAQPTGNAPIGVSLEAGSYWYCACGQSSKHPFCDGTHKGTGLAPIKFELEEAKKVWLCACKASSGQPFCDGTHKTKG